jgi:hypothetical protein
MPCSGRWFTTFVSVFLEAGFLDYTFQVSMSYMGAGFRDLRKDKPYLICLFYSEDIPWHAGYHFCRLLQQQL